MSSGELEVLQRAHQLFGDGPRQVALGAGNESRSPDGLLQRAAALNIVGGPDRYRLAVRNSREALLAAQRTDAAVAEVIARAQHDHARARELTKNVLEEARADATAAGGPPMAQREALRRRAARLRAQRAHVLAARRRAQRRRAALRALYYRVHGHGHAANRLRLPAPTGRAGIAVRAALSRLGRPYVWGATGPDRFDCSGLVQWSYARAGVHLDRTTYQQIYDGIPVPRGQVRPGDLVFPNPGHVQLAIGNNLVVEAPHAGATVRISPLGTHVQIRRPLL